MIICTLKQNLKTKHSNVQWNVFKGVYFYWEKSTPLFKIELISGEYFLPCGSKFFPGKYYSRSTFFPVNYYSGSNYLRLQRQTKVLQEEMENFSVKRVTVRAGILPLVSIATVRRVMKKTGLKLSLAQKKGELTKSDLKLRFMFSWKVRRKLSKGFWPGDLEFYLDIAIFTTK